MNGSSGHRLFMITSPRPFAKGSSGHRLFISSASSIVGFHHDSSADGSTGIGGAFACFHPRIVTS